jgi:DNA-binding NtrC family response regulator
MEPLRPQPRLLLVDDDPLVLRAMGRLMARHFEVRTALGAEAALAALTQSAEVDLFIFDMNMPPVDGPELFAEVMRRWPELRARTAVVTGAPGAEDVRDFAVRERIAVIAKPFSSSDLLAWFNNR